MEDGERGPIAHEVAVTAPAPEEMDEDTSEEVSDTPNDSE